MLQARLARASLGVPQGIVKTQTFRRVSVSAASGTAAHAG
jgi:hypothetical protein